ncbi:MAG TPA: SDR family NAD(P)-dependent oxidoreductase [Thermoanaerobaculia bacterium]|nr:SDR family NAD(P)-dependent oxidoreductase [Thermoanaerobaculia bacterium]
MSERQDGYTGLEVAIVGMACRFPGARNVEEFWRNLCGGVETLHWLSDEELEASGELAAALASPAYVRAARLIEGDDLFDAGLFGFSPREAELVDPQQRMFLECGYEALEHAGYDTERYPGLVGVFAGIKMSTYLWNIYSNVQLVQSVGDLNAQIGNDKDYVATRLSYKLGLGGPSVNVQSACSTSLVAVHLGCQALLSGECDMVLAGGVSVRTQQRGGYYYREGDILSPDGRIRTFDASASGTMFSSGMGAVLLKRLEDAVADGDHVWAVIKGSAVNNDSSLRVGFTAPGADGQERVIRAAHTAAEVDPETITYIEAHGTGTAVGDPIEVTALTRAFRARTQKRGYCAIGSVKTNIGHTAAAAGVAGLIKTSLALSHRRIPPSLHFEKPNPQIDFASSPFYVATRLMDWEANPENNEPRRAGVSAFGIGGTTAHAVLEEAPETTPSGPSRPWQLLLLSAKTETALDAMTANLAARLRENPDLPLADAAFTLQTGRRQLDQRRMLVCRGLDDAAEALEARDPKRVLSRAPETRQPPVAFLFSGQGAQHVRMMAGLYEGEPVFREHLDRCAEVLAPLLGLDLRSVLYPTDDQKEEADRKLEQTRLTQPALFAVEYALARLWMEWGVQPAAMLGHSIGEYVAACLAGVFSLEDALRLVAARGRLMQAMPPGAMTTVSLPAAEVEPLLGKQLSLAATNAPSRSVVSGPEEAVRALEEELAGRAGRSVDCRRLHTSHAFHSQMMEPALAPFLDEVGRVELKAPQMPYVSNVSGTWITAAEATDPGYWARHLRGTVRFAEGLAALFEEPHRVLIEVGPGQSLATLARQHPARGAGHAVIASARHPKDDHDDQAALLGALGQAWLAGVEVDWKGFYTGEERQRVVLPSYPFERRRYWVEMAADVLSAHVSNRRKELADWFYVPYWKPSAPPAVEERPAGTRWLVFADERGLGVEMAQRLAERGDVVATVVPGQRFADHGGGVYEIAAAREEDYDALLAGLAEDGGLPERIVHFWTVTGEGAPQVADLQELGFYSLLSLAQALGRQKLPGRVEMAVVSDGVQTVTGREPLAPEKALVLGPCRVIPQEYPSIGCRSVDVTLPADDIVRAELVDFLIEELLEARPDSVIAWRGGRRWVQGFEPVSLDRAVDGRMPLRDQGVYLITGGLGGIGLVIAEHLAQAFRARLVLTGRTALPEREGWARWLAEHGEDDAQSRRIRKVQALEDMGAEVLVLAADAADEAQMRRVVETARERFGAVHGVVHSAGVPGGGMIQLKTRQMAGDVLAPKVRGCRALEAALGGARLDFLALCSSTIAVLGNFGQADYCAANNFLDAFARDYEARTGSRAVSINWGAWREVGMAVNTKASAAVLELHGRSGKAAPLFDPAAERFHPLAGALVSDGPSSKVYANRLVPAEQWVLSEHWVAKIPTLPGTGHLEVVRAAFEHASGGAQAEIRDVFFLSPLMVKGDEPRELRVVLTKTGEAWDFRVSSRVEGAGDDSWQEHAMGKVAAAVPAPRRLDLAEIGARCAEERKVDGRVLNDESYLVYWGDRWQSLQTVHLGDGEALALLELPAAFAADLDSYKLHPALLDIATALTGMFEEDNHLPLSYSRLTFVRPLPARFYSWVRRRDDRAGGGVIASDVTLVDESGEVLVDIEGFQMKKVGEAVSRLERGGEATAPQAAAPAPAAPADHAEKGEGLFAQGGMLNAEGLEAFRRILSRRPGPQVAVSPRDLNAAVEQLARQRDQSLLDNAAKGPARAAHPRPNMQTAYVEPRTATERLLAGVWQDVLGIETVGVHDNFFELGGDSVLGIQVLARARAAGVELTSNQLFQHQTVADLAAVVGEVAPAAPALPADAPLITQEEREALERLLGDREVEDAYPLSPLQQGLMFHSLTSPDSGLYLEQMTCALAGSLDAGLLEQAWQLAMGRHPVLRTSFVWEGLDRPLQVVSPWAPAGLVYEDWRGLAPEEQRERLAERWRQDRRTPFRLDQAPLMRTHVLQTADDIHELVWSHHHLLLDGWSSPLLLREVFTLYEILARGGQPAVEPARRFRDYVQWLAGQDTDQAEAFWRRNLAGFNRPTPVATDRPEDGSGDAAREHDRVDSPLTPETTAALQTVARQGKFTLNNIAQGLWALLLGRAAGTRDVVFGITMSSRPAEIAGVESIVGLFINALPVRVRIDPGERLADWFKSLQDFQATLLEVAHTPLVDVQRWSEVPADQPLFETLYEFWNFPINTGELDTKLRMLNPRYDVATNYLLGLRIVPFEGYLDLQLAYDRRRFDRSSIEGWLDALSLALQTVAALGERPEATVADLEAALDQAEAEQRRARAAEVSGVAAQMLKQRVRRRGTPTGAEA